MPVSCVASVAHTALRRGNWRARFLRGFNQWSYAQAAAGRRSAIEVVGSSRGLLSQLHTSRQLSSLVGLRQPAVSVAAYGCILMPKSSLATLREDQKEKELVGQDEDPFDPLTDRIPEKPVTVAEGASYGLVILAGLAIAASAVYAVFKELIFEPKEYKIFGKALERVQNDSQVTVRLGTPITGYGQESRNRAARQRISNKVWKDEDGVERVEVVFFIRGPHGAGKVYTEMFKDKLDRTWKFTYLIVDVLSPTPTRLMLESYVPA